MTTANQFIARSSSSTPTSWAAIDSAATLFSGTLIIDADNSGTIAVRDAGDTANTATLKAGDVIPMVRVDLTALQIQASAADQAYRLVGDNDRGFR